MDMSMENFLTHGKKRSKTLFKSRSLKMRGNTMASDLDGTLWGPQNTRKGDFL